LLEAEAGWSEALNKIHAQRLDEVVDGLTMPSAKALKRYDVEKEKYEQELKGYEAKKKTFTDFQATAEGEALAEIKEMNWPMFSPKFIEKMDLPVLREVVAMLGWAKRHADSNENARALIERGVVLHKPDESRFNSKVDWTGDIARRLNASKIKEKPDQLRALLVAAKLTGNSQYLAAAKMHIQSISGEDIDVEGVLGQSRTLAEPEKVLSSKESLEATRKREEMAVPAGGAGKAAAGATKTKVSEGRLEGNFPSNPRQ
jgi:hypothetical protein